MRFGFGRHGGPPPFGINFGPPRGWGDWASGWDEFERGGRGGRRRRQFDSAELRLILLHLIAEQPRHGYDLIRAIEEMSGGAYAPSPGVVYPTLTMLQDMGHIEEAPGEGSRRNFSVTQDGRAWLEERRDEADALLARLAELGAKRRRTGGAPIGRAVSNLLSAIWHRVTRDDMNEEALHDIAAILDEAAQKIERLKSAREGEA